MEDSFRELVDAVRKGRKYCPWCSKVTSNEYSEELVKEAQEIVQAINSNDNKNLQEEIGDLLWDTLTLAIIAEEEGKISARESLKGVVEKMRKRKPFIFEGKHVSLEEAMKIWHEAKAREKNDKGNHI